jgi:hypothetical protein
MLHPTEIKSARVATTEVAVRGVYCQIVENRKRLPRRSGSLPVKALAFPFHPSRSMFLLLESNHVRPAGHQAQDCA